MQLACNSSVKEMFMNLIYRFSAYFGMCACVSAIQDQQECVMSFSGRFIAGSLKYELSDCRLSIFKFKKKNPRQIDRNILDHNSCRNDTF